MDKIRMGEYKRLKTAAGPVILSVGDVKHLVCYPQLPHVGCACSGHC